MFFLHVFLRVFVFADCQLYVFLRPNLVLWLGSIVFLHVFSCTEMYLNVLKELGYFWASFGVRLGPFCMYFYRYSSSREALCLYFYMEFALLGLSLQVFFTGFPIAGGYFACVFTWVSHSWEPFCMCFYRYAYSWEALCTYFYLVFLQLGSILHVFLHVSL